MGHTKEFTAIVLKTYDVSDADRFCILLTRERGKIAARAKGVRKLKSKMGGSLLAPNMVSITLHEGSGGNLITGSRIEGKRKIQQPLAAFLEGQQAIEMLIAVLEDDHPVPEVFDLLKAFLEEDHALLGFTIKLLSLLGLLPQDSNHQLFEHISNEEKQFLELSLQRKETDEPTNTKHLKTLCDRILDHHLSKSLKAGMVARSMQ